MTQQWISVKDRLPVEHVGLNLLVTNGIEVWIGDYDPRPKPKERWGVVYNGAPPFDSTEITHWMPLPAPPGLEPSEEPMYQVGNGLPCTFKDNPPRVELLNQ